MALQTKCKACFGGPQADFKWFPILWDQTFSIFGPFFLLVITLSNLILLNLANTCSFRSSAPYQIADPVLWWPRLYRPCVERISAESILFAISPIANSGLRTPSSEAPLPVFACGHRLIVLSILLQNPFLDTNMHHLLIQNEASMHGKIAVPRIFHKFWLTLSTLYLVQEKYQ